jgi:hypothetical protein
MTLEARAGADLEGNRIPLLPPSLLVFPYKGWPDWSPTARVQRGPSEGARCASKGD